jgi:hypothetical protein
MRPIARLILPIAALALAGLGCHRSKASQAAVVAPGGTIQGEIKEVLPAPPYDYLRIATAGGDVWAAIPAADLKVGARISVQVQLHQPTFESPSLHRTFQNLYMGTVPGLAPAAPMAAQPAPAVTPVAKAQGGDARAIAEVYAQKDKLKDRTVTVRGKVVKYNEGILGKTWIHLQDGSGTQATRDFDLAVTTKGTSKLGEVITIKGTLRLARDFGSGYTYPVIVEDAKIVK